MNGRQPASGREDRPGRTVDEQTMPSRAPFASITPDGDTEEALPQTESRARSSRPAASSETVRRNMSRQRRRDTGCEMAVRKILHAEGMRYRVDFRPLTGERFRVDIGWKKYRLAVFIDGCFWHGCPDHGTLPKSNSEWWADKLTANAQRDERTDKVLRANGWTVLRFWEHEEPDLVASSIRRHLKRPVASGGDPTWQPRTQRP